MGTKMIPLSQLESDPRGTLNECCDSGEALVVELPDKRMVTIQPLEPDEDDSLVSELLENHSLAEPKARMLPRDAGKKIIHPTVIS